MADGIAESVGLTARGVPGHRVTARMMGAADEGSRSIAVLAPATLRPVLSHSAELLGVSPGGWVGAALLYAGVIAGGLWAAWHVTPPEPWPESEATFRVIFETPPPPSPAEVIPAPPEAPPPPVAVAPPEPPPPPEATAEPEPPPPPETIAEPEPPPPVVAVEPEPAEVLPPPPPPKPEPRRVVAKPHTSVAPAPSPAVPAAEPPVAAPQVAALPIIPPQPITGRASNPKPDYPTEARRRGLQGKVVLLVEVSAAGVPASVAVAASSGHAALDQAALAAVQHWHFNPATRGGTPVAGTAQVPIQFRLEE